MWLLCKRRESVFNTSLLHCSQCIIKTRVGRAHQFASSITHLVCCGRQNGGLYTHAPLFLQKCGYFVKRENVTHPHYFVVNASLIPTSIHAISYADAFFSLKNPSSNIYFAEDKNPILFSST